MVWPAISYKAAIRLAGIEGNIDSKYCRNVLQNGLVERADGMISEDWILQQVDAATRQYRHSYIYLHK